MAKKVWGDTETRFSAPITFADPQAVTPWIWILAGIAVAVLGALALFHG